MQPIVNNRVNFVISLKCSSCFSANALPKNLCEPTEMPKVKMVASKTAIVIEDEVSPVIEAPKNLDTTIQKTYPKPSQDIVSKNRKNVTLPILNRELTS